jgi:KipI family sensor histidine kinase inhibitor
MQSEVKPVGRSNQPVLSSLGDSALLLSWTAVDDQELAALVCRAMQTLRAAGIPGITGIVPGFASLAVHFDLLHASYSQMRCVISEQLGATRAMMPDPIRRIRIPVCFDAAVAPDLGEVCQFVGCSVRQFVDVLCSTVFTVRMIGFSPGFPYLTGLPECFAIPRRSTPRVKVPAGSFAVGGGQAGIYPEESPGGWHLIGRTNVKLFDVKRESSCLLDPGDEVQLVEIATLPPDFGSAV